jgi:hypothetical protein
MIKINLLPVEKRKPEKTPLPRFGLILTNVAVGALVAVALIWQFLMMQSDRISRDEKKKTKDSLQGDVAKWAAADAERSLLTTQHEEVSSITGTGVMWWEIMDALWEVVNDNPRIWLDDIASTDAPGATSVLQGYDPGRSTPPPPFGLAITCHSAGLDVLGMTKFRHDLREHPRLKRYFAEINFPVEWTVSEEPDYTERYSLSFRVNLIGAERPAPAPPTETAPAGAQP